MFSNLNVMDYFKEVSNSTRFQVAATISFGTALILIWINTEIIRILGTILFLFPLSMLITSLIEKIYTKVEQSIKRKKDWNNLTPEEQEFVKFYIKNNTKTRYMIAYNGTWQDSGIVNPLVNKKILYLASNMSEFRGEDWQDMEQRFPFNINDNAFEFFKEKLGATND